jgi:hypothetical protein
MKVKNLIDYLVKYDGELEVKLGYDLPVIIQGREVNMPVIVENFSIDTLPSKSEYLAVSAIILLAKH